MSHFCLPIESCDVGLSDGQGRLLGQGAEEGVQRETIKIRRVIHEVQRQDGEMDVNWMNFWLRRRVEIPTKLGTSEERSTQNTWITFVLLGSV